MFTFSSDKWMACQSMDNQIMIFGVLNRFRQNRKKTFKGHMVAGYACQLNFSPDGSYLISGDADGKLCIWDWKSTKLYSKFKAHDAVCISCLWHPHETSKVVTCGWDGLIKYWDWVTSAPSGPSHHFLSACSEPWRKWKLRPSNGKMYKWQEILPFQSSFTTYVTIKLHGSSHFQSRSKWMACRLDWF